MQAFEWTKLIMEGVRPWENPFGAPQFGAIFFMITGFHGTHVTIGVIFLIYYGYERLGEEILIQEEEVSLHLKNLIMKQLKLWDYIGTSLTWFGSLFLHFSIYGEVIYGRRYRATSIKNLFPSMDTLIYI